MKARDAVCGALAALLAAAPSDALAESEVDLTANAGIVSDYRFRGVSLSGKKPAVQGGIDLETGPFFVGTWASTIAQYEGADTEVDFYAGLQGTLGAVAWRAGGYGYLYPHGEGTDYVEMIGQAETSMGPITLGLEGALAPRQANLDEANLYVGASSALDVGRGWTVLVRGGYEDGFYKSKWDWELGASYTLGKLTGSLSYVDTNQGASDELASVAQGGLIGSLLIEF